MNRHGPILAVSIMGFLSNKKNNIIIHVKVKGMKLKLARHTLFRLGFNLNPLLNQIKRFLSKHMMVIL